MELTLQSMKAVSDLMDQALALDDKARTQWLVTLSTGNHASLAPIVRQLLANRASMSTNFLSKPLQIDGVTSLNDLAKLTPTIVAGSRVGPYELTREIGGGGMGVVWLAERSDGQLDRQVALKLPMLHATAALAERFVRERNILSQLEHPNIARLYDAGVAESGQPFLVLEYIEGLPITAHCDLQRLSIADRLRRFLSVTRAVQYAHANLVVHRDLKPNNILVSDDGEVHLLDFGIAKLLDHADQHAQETELTMLAGRALTLDYASPEQVLGKPISTACDVYSLGVTLYLLLSGCKPYRIGRNDRISIEKKIAEIDPKPMSSRATEEFVDSASLAQPEAALAGETTMTSIARASSRQTSPERLARMLRGDLDTIVAKAMRKASNERYETVAEFAADIERYLAGLPVSAQPESLAYRTRKFVSRNRVAVSASAAVAASLIAGLGAALWQASVANVAAARADNEAAIARIEKSRADNEALAAARSAERARLEARNAREAQLHASEQSSVAGREAARADKEASAARTAASRAKEEAQLARRETARSNAVQGFLVDVFDATSVHQPDAVQARTLTAKALLDRGAQKLSDHRNVPEAVSASLFRLFGTLYDNLNEREQAALMLKRGVELSEKVYGRDSREYALAALDNAWAEGNHQLGRNLPQIVEARVTLQKHAPRSEALAQAWAYEAHNSLLVDPARSLSAATEALTLLDSTNSSKKIRAIAVRAQAHAHRMRNEDHLALAKYGETETLFAELYGSDNIEVAEAKGGKASILNGMLRLSEADAELRQVIAIMRRFDGALADAKAFGRAISLVQADRGDTETALNTLLSTHRTIRADQSKSHGLAFTLSLEAANVAMLRGDFEQALTLSRQSRAEYADHAPRTLAVLLLLEGRAQLGLNNVREAEKLLIDAKRVIPKSSAGRFNTAEMLSFETQLRIKTGELVKMKQSLVELEALRSTETRSLREKLADDVLRAHVNVALGEWAVVREIARAWISPKERVEVPKHLLSELYFLLAQAGLHLRDGSASEWYHQAKKLVELNDVASSSRVASVRALEGKFE